jgi:hypothetical protein
MVTIGGTIMGSGGMVTIGGTIMGSGGSFSVTFSVKGGSMFIVACTISGIAL